MTLIKLQKSHKVGKRTQSCQWHNNICAKFAYTSHQKLMNSTFLLSYLSKSSHLVFFTATIHYNIKFGEIFGFGDRIDSLVIEWLVGQLTVSPVNVPDWDFFGRSFTRQLPTVLSSCCVSVQPQSSVLEAAAVPGSAHWCILSLPACRCPLAAGGKPRAPTRQSRKRLDRKFLD